ncbi:MAG: PDZ domain-containing protein, partial [Thermodesulfovibrionales bacterium]|nr:PDZ domain-containing protein [Thermodesulfovibrionales bacterium]
MKRLCLLFILLIIFLAIANVSAEERAWLGVSIQDVTEEVARAFKLDKTEGALVVNVVKGGPAEEAGIKEGDVILEFNGKKIKTYTDLLQAVSTLKPGDKTMILVLRDGKKLSFIVKLGSSPLYVQSLASKTLSEKIYLPIESVATPKLLKILSGHSESVYSCVFSPDGKHLASGGQDKKVILWDVETGKVFTSLEGHTKWIIAVIFSPDGKLLATRSGDETVKIWDVKTGKELQTLQLYSFDGSRRTSIQFSPDSKLLATADGKKAILWDVATGRKLKTFDDIKTPASVAFSPDGKLLAITGNNKAAILIDLINFKELKIFEYPKSELKYRRYEGKEVYFSPDGKLIVAKGYGVDDSKRTMEFLPVVIFDVATGKEIRILHRIYNFYAFVSNTKILTDGTDRVQAILWDITTGEKIQEFGYFGGIEWGILSLSPDSKLIAMGDRFGKVSIYEAVGIEIAEFFKKDEFETTQEYFQRVKNVKIPYSTKVKLGRYDADKGGFEIEIGETKAHIPVQRDKAMEISANKDVVYINGNLVYADKYTLELVDARLTLDPTAPKIPAYAKKPAYTPKPVLPLIEEKTVENIREIPDFKSSPRPDDFAIVIGIEKYQGLPKSDFSKGDALIVKDYLKALGFQERNIELITDEKATKSAIEKAIEAWLPNRVKRDSRVFVYYSGHGAPEPKTGDAYIVPFDGDPNYLEVTGYPLKKLYEKLGKIQAQEVIVLLDSCFSGAGGRSVLAKGARPLVIMADITT